MDITVLFKKTLIPLGVGTGQLIKLKPDEIKDFEENLTYKKL